MDLETILTKSIGLNWEVHEKKKHVSAIKKIYKSQNNDFGKELSRALYYYLLMDDKNMLKEAFKRDMGSKREWTIGGKKFIINLFSPMCPHF